MALDTANADLLARFAVEHYEANSISEGRRIESDRTLRSLAERLDGRSLIELTPSDLMAWQAAMLAQGMAPVTVGKYQNMIRAFVRWAYAAGLMSFELSTQLRSVNGVRGSSVRATPRPYKRSEIQEFRELIAGKFPLVPSEGRGSRALRNFLAGRGRFYGPLRTHAKRLQMEAQVSLALEEGLRLMEIFNLSIEDMHPANDAVVVRTAKGKPGEHREREVPYTAHSRLCVQEWLDLRALLATGHDFPWLSLQTSDSSVPMSERQMREMLWRTLPGKWSWHRFRHTFATERLRAGMPLEQVQVMMGHAEITQTLRYAQIVSADVRAEAARSEAAFVRNLGLSTD